MRQFPPELKVPAILRKVPRSHASDLRWRFSKGARVNDTLKSCILAYTQHVRFDSAYSKSDNDMQVEAFGYEKSDDWSDWISVAEPSEVSAFYEGVAAGLSWECPEVPVPEDSRDMLLDALYHKSKGKDKGKNKGKGQKGNFQDGTCSPL